MKAIILAGGLGTRLSEETATRPKPMVEIGGKPILWHILKTYSHYGINDFVICCGYKGYMIKEYFANYFLHTSDITFNIKSNEMIVHQKRAEHWNISLVDTGDNSMTGGRLLRVATHVKNEDAFCFTYGDGLIDSDIGESIAFHRRHGKAATLTAAFPPGRFGAIDIDKDNSRIMSFKEKGDSSYVNAGYFILSPEVLEYIKDDSTIWEQEPLMKLAADGQLMAYKHSGFWQPMDTMHDKQTLENLWGTAKAPWKKWE
jgi:glucose-1-phosphate cytidylyltransferase